jgi:hypothetical protein
VMEVHSFLEIDMMIAGSRQEFCNVYLSNHNIYDIVVHCIGGVYGTKEVDQPLDAWIDEWVYNVGSQLM